MNFNIYVDNPLGRELTEYAAAHDIPRNSLIREALARFMQNTQKGWPEVLLAFQGAAHFPAFEASRRELRIPREDPFA